MKKVNLASVIRAVSMAIACFAILCGVWLVLPNFTQVIRVSDLPKHLGISVTIHVVTGTIIASRENDLEGVYHVNDVYGGDAYIRFDRRRFNYPSPWLTYQITGIPLTSTIPVEVQLQRIRRVMPLTEIFLIVMVLLIVAVIGWIFSAKMLGSALSEVVLPPIWGYATVDKGPDQGKVFPLRFDFIPVGHIGDPLRAIVLSADYRVSRDHGIIHYTPDEIEYTDNQSKNHSFIDGKQLPDKQPVSIRSGTKIRLGEETYVTITLAGELSQATEEAGAPSGYFETQN